MHIQSCRKCCVPLNSITSKAGASKAYATSKATSLHIKRLSDFCSFVISLFPKATIEKILLRSIAHYSVNVTAFS